MTKRKLVTGASLLVLFSLGASCVPSARPLSDEKTSKLDSQLIGRWQEVGGDEVWDVRQWPGTSATFEAIQVRPVPQEPDGRPPEAKRLFTFRIGSQRYLSLEASSPGAPEVYWIARYELPEPGALRVYPLDDGGVARAIEAKDLRGTVKTTGSPGEIKMQVALDDSREDLIRYLGQHGPEGLFAKKAITYRRK